MKILQVGGWACSLHRNANKSLRARQVVYPPSKKITIQVSCVVRKTGSVNGDIEMVLNFRKI